MTEIEANDRSETVSRRGVLSSALAGAGLWVAGVPALAASEAAAVPSAPPPAPLPLKQPVPQTALDSATLDKYIRLRSAPNFKPVFWLYGGVLLLRPEGEVARPVVGVGGLSTTRAIPRGDGVYDWDLDEVGYYRDLQTGAVLDTWVNPLTGQTVKPANYRSPEKLQYRRDGVFTRDQSPPGTEFQGCITTLAAVGGIIAMTEDLYVSVPARPAADGKPARPAQTMASLGTFTCIASELERGHRGWVDAQLSYTTMNTFARWLGMAGMPGMQNMRLSGRKLPVSAVDQIPRWLRERINKDHPTYLDVAANWQRGG